MKMPLRASRAWGSTVLSAKRNSPHIFFGVGLVGAIGAVVMACRATLELEETLEEVREEVRQANESSNELIHSQDVLTPEIIDHAELERAKEVSVITFKGVVAVGKLYAPAIVIGSISVACLAGSHVQLTRRNAALSAAFAALTKSFEDYRARVRAEVGEERELDIYRSTELIEIVDEKGKKQLVRAVNPDGLSLYAKCFDSTNPEWKNNPEFNRTFLDYQEKWANHKLERDGHLFLNDVYKMLGFEPTALGQLVGWITNSEVGDSWVDFGMWEARNTRFMNALEPSIWLDFNVEGNILDKLP